MWGVTHRFGSSLYSYLPTGVGKSADRPLMIASSQDVSALKYLTFTAAHVFE